MGFDPKSLPPEELHELGRPRRARFPLFVLDTGSKRQDVLRAIEAEVKSSLEEPSTGTPLQLSPSEFFEGFAPMMDRVAARGPGKHDPAKLEKLFADFEELHEVFVGELVVRVLRVLIAHSRMDAGLFSFAVRSVNPPGEREQKAFVLACVVPEPRRFELDAGPRDAVRAGAVSATGEVEWCEWDTGALELPGPARRLPVWVQDHAFERLRQRIPAPSIEGYTHGTLFESLRHPRITANQGDGTFLVEYRWHDVRVGHLAVTVLEDAVLVRTFLFLTMQGTPEAAKLRARLKLKRRDIEWLDLDSFSVFLLSDMGKDPELKRIFDECGCGHLLTLVPASGEPAMKVADEVRKYLKLGDPVRRDRARQEPE